MQELFYNLMHPLPNALMTIIVGILVVYWLFVFLTGAGFDDLGFDLDVNVPDADAPDIEPDADADPGNPDNDATTEKQPGPFMRFLNFMNVGKVPFMLVLSTLKFFSWVGTLITTQFIDVSSWGAWSLLILLPIIFVCVFITKLATTPMVKFFKAIGYKGEEEIDFLGRSGKMLSTIQEKKIGTAEFMIDKNPIKLNVVSIDGEEIKYGDYVIIADESDDKKIYYVSKEDSLRNY